MKLELYARDGCSLCTKAKQYLNDMNMPYYEHVIVEDNSTEPPLGRQLVYRSTVMNKYPDAKKLPLVIVDDKYIGTFEELLQLFEYRRELLHALKLGVISVLFTKKNGELRHMNCTTNSSLIPEEKKSQERSSKAFNHITVFDTDVQDWRSFKLENVHIPKINKGEVLR